MQGDRCLFGGLQGVKDILFLKNEKNIFKIPVHLIGLELSDRAGHMTLLQGLE